MGHTKLLSSFIGGAILGIYGAAAFSKENVSAWLYFDSSGEAVGVSFIFGAGIGAATGGIIKARGKRQCFRLTEMWKTGKK